jgi:hypothetical protein
MLQQLEVAAERFSPRKLCHGLRRPTADHAQIAHPGDGAVCDARFLNGDCEFESLSEQ